MKVRVLIEMDDGGVGIRAVNVLDSAMRAYNEKLSRAVPDAAIDFEVLGVVPDAEVRAGVVAEEPEWEFGVRLHARHLITGTNTAAFTPPTTPHPTMERAIEMARLNHGYRPTFHRRRKAGPWVPVKQEGAGQ